MAVKQLKNFKAYEYRMKSDIKKKIKTFAELEMPLLIEKGFFNNLDLSIYNQNLRISPQAENEIISQLPCDIQFQSQNMVGRKGCVTITVLKEDSQSPTFR
jgi:hypothetical protein